MTGLTSDMFWQEQRNISPRLARDLVQEIRELQQREHYIPTIQTIITGVDHDGEPHIWVVDGTGRCSCSTDLAFATVGSGARQAESLFLVSGYSSLVTLPRALWLTYSAKRRADVSGGVGPYTDLFTIGYQGKGFRLLKSSFVKELGKVFDRLGKQLARVGMKAVDRVAPYIENSLPDASMQIFKGSP